MLALALAGCGGADDRGAGIHVGELPLHDAVVELVATRDGVDTDAARTRAADVLRWAQRRRERLGEAAELAPERAAHLRRSALARLYLQTVFEPTHGPDDLAADDPRLVKARADPRNVHPTIHEVCQVVVAPPGKFDPETTPARTADPRWRAVASARLEAFAAFVRQAVPPGDPEACTLLARLRRFAPADDDEVVIRVENAVGFDLDACAVTGDDGRCSEPRFASEWTEVVREGEVPGFRGPFPSRFGLHLALVHAVLPAASADAPGFDDAVRADITPRWRAEALAALLEDLRTREAVQVLGGERR